MHQIITKSRSNPTKHYIYYVYAPPVGGIGQSSSVMLDQNTQIITTESRVNSVSKRAPSIFPCVPLQIYLLMTYWKIWPIANKRAAASRYTENKSGAYSTTAANDLRIGFLSPSTLSTNIASRTKKTTTQMSGMS